MDTKVDDKNTWFRKRLFENERPLIRYAHKIIMNLEPSREVVQDTFLKLWAEKFPTHKENYPVAWLYRVCRNGAIDYLRKSKRELSSDDLESILATPCLNQELLDTNIIFKEINKLPKKEQEVLLLKFQEDLSYKEIASITGYTVSNVGLIIHESVKKLRKVLTTEE